MRNVGVAKTKRAVRGAAHNVQRDKLRSMNRKYHAGPDPLDRETLLDTIQPQAKDELRAMTAHLDKMFADGTPEQQQALELWKFQAASGSVKDVVRLEFMRRFYFWLLGRGDEDDVKKTLWGRGNAAAFNGEVAAYIEQFVNKRTEFALKLAQLSQRVPDSLNGYYLYFKYIVNGALSRIEKDGNSFWDMSQEDYLEDFDIFQQVFKEKTLLGGEKVDSAYADIIRPMADYRGAVRPYEGHVPFPVVSSNLKKDADKGASVSAISKDKMLENAADSLHKSLNLSSGKKDSGFDASDGGASFDVDDTPPPPDTGEGGRLDDGGAVAAPPPIVLTGGDGAGSMSAAVSGSDDISLEVSPIKSAYADLDAAIAKLSDKNVKIVEGMHKALKAESDRLGETDKLVQLGRVANMIESLNYLEDPVKDYGRALRDHVDRQRGLGALKTPYTGGKGKEEANDPSPTPMRKSLNFDGGDSATKKPQPRDAEGKFTSERPPPQQSPTKVDESSSVTVSDGSEYSIGDGSSVDFSKVAPRLPHPSQKPLEPDLSTTKDMDGSSYERAVSEQKDDKAIKASIKRDMEMIYRQLPEEERKRIRGIIEAGAQSGLSASESLKIASRGADGDVKNMSRFALALKMEAYMALKQREAKDKFRNVLHTRGYVDKWRIDKYLDAMMDSSSSNVPR